MKRKEYRLEYLRQKSLSVKYILLLCFLLVTFLVASCTQDPLAGLPEPAKNRFNMLSDFELKRKTLDSQAEEVSHTFGRILADDFWLAASDKEFEMILTAKVFLDEDQFDEFDIKLEDPVFENEDYSLSQILNDTENKNEKKYLFKWTPSEDFLSNYLEKCIPVKFTLQTSGDLAFERPDVFKLFVTNKSKVPVLQIVDMFREIQEGDEGVMRVHIFDPQATDMNPPVLILDKIELSEDAQIDERQPRDLNQLLHFMQGERIDENIWELEYRLIPDILEAGLDNVPYTLNMFAISVSGVSDTHQVTLTVFNRVLIPKVVGPASLQVRAGQTYSVFIQVSDHLDSGELSSRLLTAAEDMPGDVEFDYNTTSDGMRISLYFSIPEDVDASQEYEASIEILNEGLENSRRVLESVVHNVSIEILP